MGDQGDRKTVRAFQCRDYLFEIYDRMSADLGCSVDYLINEAMREYARAREQTVAGIDAEELMASAAVGAASVSHPAQSVRPAPMLTPVPPPMSPQPALTAPPPLPGHRPSQSSGRRRLVLKFNGQTFPIDKDEFIIGRGARSADLAIRDGNISRRHAAIVFHDGVYFMKDLGSTNGIEYAGQRVESKRIEEGDVYSICDYEIRFSYR
jgi:hypothetical protein